MPELPDVEYFRKKSRKILRKRIKMIRLNAKKMSNVSENILNKHLKKKSFKATGRYGKYLFLSPKNKKTLALHFGMSGDVAYWKDNRPKYSVIEIDLANGYTFSVISRRKFGKMLLIDDVGEITDRLGKDALDITENEFKQVLGSSSGYVKTTLMDQKKIAGLGNIYSDEILYHAKIAPNKKVSQLSSAQAGQLYEKMKLVLGTAIDANADPNRLPDGYLLPHRKEGASLNGHKIKTMRIGGRTSYFCPDIQV